MSPTHRRLAVVWLSGFSTMALQMAAVRVLAPVVGASILVWATTIALSLLAMTLGYLLGGRLAVRVGSGRLLTLTLGSAAVLTALVPVLREVWGDRITLGLTHADTATVVGALVGFLAMFAAPAVLLGVTPPFVMHLALDDLSRGGRTAGGLYAFSTIGSIVGTLLPGLVLLQWLGSADTLRVVAGMLAVAAALAWWLGSTDRRTPGGQSQRAGVTPRGGAGLGVPAVLIAVVLAEGVATMTTEISTARMVAPFFGSSHAVWAILVATALGAIALGSHLGGKAADRWPTRAGLAVLMVVSAVAVSVLPFLMRPLLLISDGSIEAVDVPRLVSTFLGSMLLAAIPMTLLGMAPPWALRIALASPEVAGRVAGRLYALSTAGALVGTMVTTIWLVPWIGTRRTLLLAAILVAGTALVLARPRGRAALAGGVVVAVGIAGLALVPTGLVKPVDGEVVLAERETRYQFVQVVERPGGRRYLQMNEGWAVHSVYDPDQLLTGGYWDAFLALPALTAPTTPTGDLLVLGNAGGTVPRLFRHYWPDVDVDGVELDPVVTELGEEWLDLSGPNLTVTTADARPFLAHAGDRVWDMIVVDTYRQPYIPFYLTTQEFFTAVRDRLAPGGILAINVSRTPEDTRIEDHLARTLHEVFGYVGRYPTGAYNDVLVAAAVAPSATGAGRIEVDADIAGIVRSFADGLRPVPLDQALRPLTDDRAPVEWMTDLMIFGQAG